MSRYIDADLLLENLIETAKGLPEEDRAPYLFCALLIDEEGKHPADVVEVTRCKDCRYSEAWTDINGTHSLQCEVNFDHMGYGMEVETYHFCRYGEKDGEQE